MLSFLRTFFEKELNTFLHAFFLRFAQYGFAWKKRKIELRQPNTFFTY
jgi:hypothetical protein